MNKSMTVKELIKKLRKFPQDKTVMIEVDGYCESVGEIKDTKYSVIIQEEQGVIR